MQVELPRLRQGDHARSGRTCCWSWLEEQEGYLLKPMNCPHHIQIYKAEPRSYRDLPVRLAEFGTVYRFEQTGELSGMTRVRGFTQDDAHLFVTPEQIEAEFGANIDLVLFVLSSLGLNDYRVRVGLRDPTATSTSAAPRTGTRRRAHCCRLVKSLRHELHAPSRARRRSTGRRSTSWSATASAASGSSARCSSTTTCRSGSSWNTSARTTRRIGR